MNKSNTSISNPQESWASTVSDYIIKRRKQTFSAYTKEDSNYNHSAESKDYESNGWLFKSLMIVLVKQLEEGHTVFILTAYDNETAVEGVVRDKVINLYQWQYDLLELLAAPLYEVINSSPTSHSGINQQHLGISNNRNSDMHTPHTASLFDLLELLLSKGTQLWLQSSLSANEKTLLVERFNLIKRNFEMMQQLNIDNNQRVSATESLQLYQQKIKQHPMIGYLNECLSEINSLSNSKPIICKNNTESKEFNFTFWLHRTWQAEYNLAEKIQNILNQSIVPLPIKIPDNLNKQQVEAVQIANENAFSIITGGPGTGKTYTVAQLVIALQQAQEANSEVGSVVKFSTDSAGLALAAPTGKAAQRMQESLQEALSHASVDVKLQEAKTIHRLLGIGRDGRPRYHAENPLGEDIIIVDEASMLGVELANYLVSAVKPGARLILLGDANQLAAVDAGAVLADLCRIPVLQPIHAQLTESRRFDSDSGIGKLATLINDDKTNIKQVWQLLNTDTSLSFQAVNLSSNSSYLGSHSSEEKGDNNLLNSKTINSLSNKKILNNISKLYSNFIKKIAFYQNNPVAKSDPSLVNNTISEIMHEFNRFRVLSAGHHGEWGDATINQFLTNWHITTLKLPLGKSPWFHGRPIMVLQNNYELGLFNGDIGICLQTKIDGRGEGGQLEIFFENKTQGIAVNLLNEDLVATAYAMTIHKSQGSEFEHVAITFDSAHSRLLSKELIYTAVTRAKKQVTIYSTKSALEKAVKTPTERLTGLALQFK